MSNSHFLSLPFVMGAQSQKHVTVNEALRKLDALIHIAVISRTLSTPPASPAEGARYIVGASSSAAWAAQSNKIAVWQDGAWAFFPPQVGWTAWVTGENRRYIYTDAGWTAESTGSSSPPSSASTPSVMGANGSRMEFLIKEYQHTLGLSATTIQNAIPANTTVLSIAIRVLETMTGPGISRVGVTGSSTRYTGSMPNRRAGETFILAKTSLYFYPTQTGLLITPLYGGFRTGRLSVALNLMRFTPPAR